MNKYVKLIENDESNIYAVENYEGVGIRSDPKLMLSHRADFALKLMLHFAIVATKPDGNDEAGRQKLALLDPLEVVNRAMQISDIAITKFQEQGWLFNIPSLDDALDALEKDKKGT